MSNEIALNTGVLESVLLNGDLSALSSDDRAAYMLKVCESLGLNPLTKPFEYMKLQGKLTLYARKDATEQLRKLHNISIEIRTREVVEDCYCVWARATNGAGRHDESIGAVNIAGLKGEARANAMMKAETKAKRRVTLSISGLGMLDEHEVETIPGVIVGEPTAKALPKQQPADPLLFEPLETQKKPMSEKTFDSICSYMGFIDVKTETVANWLAKGGVDTLDKLTEEQGQGILQWFAKQEEQMNQEMQAQNHAWANEATA